MEFRQFDQTYIVRLEAGEEIHATLKAFCQRQGIHAGSLTGIGVLRGAKLGFFHRDTNQYSWLEVNIDHELTSLMGNISMKEGEPWLHLHATLSDPSGRVIGGHLKSGVIGVTGEIVIQVVEGALDRRQHPEFDSYFLSLEG